MTGSPFWRLVWKEYRMQRAFWLSMVGLTFLIQLLLVSFSQGDPRSAPQVATNVFGFALFFAGLYALGCGATLFATERETGTYEFQRMVPISWLRLLAAKTTFAALSTLAILAVLLVLAAWLSRWNLPDQQSAGELWALFGFGAVELLLWGILFSLIVDQPLMAVILAISTVPTYVHLLAFHFEAGQPMSGYVKALPLRVAIAAVVCVVDLLLARRWLKRGDKPLLADERGRRMEKPVASSTFGPEPLSPPGEVLFRRLLWQQWRQSRRMILVIAISIVPLMIVVPVTLSCVASISQPLDHDGGLTALFLLVAILAGLMGSCVFLGDQRREQFRFFAEHGARPGYVWLSRQAVWIAAAALLVLLALLPCLLAARVSADWEIRSTYFAVWERPPGYYTGVDYAGPMMVLVFGRVWDLVLCAAVAYAAGQFCSMLFRSGILAAVFGLMLGAAILAWTLLMRLLALNTLWAAAPIPLVLLLATRLRTNDWILHRKTLGAWLRVGTVVLVPITAILAAVPVMRVRSVPVVDSGMSPGEYQREPTAEEQATAAMYQRARDVYKSYQQFVPPKPPGTPPEAERETQLDAKTIAKIEDAWAKANQDAIAILLEATKRPLGDVRCPPRIDYVHPPGPSYSTLTHLLVASARLVQREGRWDEAMERYLAALRLSRYVGYYACERYRDRDELSVYEELPKWALLPGQTPGRIAAMLKELGQLIPTFPSRANVLKARYVLARDAIDRDPDALQEFPIKPRDVFWRSFCARWFPWEKERARRALDLATYSELDYCRVLELDLPDGDRAQGHDYAARRWQAREGQTRLWQSYGRFLASPILPEGYFPRLDYRAPQDILDLKTERAVVQLVLGVEAWRLAHGRLPDSLGALQGTYLERVPKDPSSGQPFRYLRDGFPFEVIAAKRDYTSAPRPLEAIPAGTPLLASSSVDLTLGKSVFSSWQPGHQRAADYYNGKEDKWYAERVFPLPYPQHKAATAGRADPAVGRDVLAATSPE